MVAITLAVLSFVLASIVFFQHFGIVLSLAALTMMPVHMQKSDIAKTAETHKAALTGASKDLAFSFVFLVFSLLVLLKVIW